MSATTPLDLQQTRSSSYSAQQELIYKNLHFAFAKQYFGGSTIFSKRGFNFRGINLSHLRHYYQGLRVQCNNDTELFVSCLPVYLIKQTSLEESSWMSLYLESIGVVRGDPCEIRESFFRHC